MAALDRYPGTPWWLKIAIALPDGPAGTTGIIGLGGRTACRA